MTEHPTAGWAASVVQRAMLAGGRRAKYLVRDRDAIYGGEFKAAMRGLGLRQLVCAYKSPLQNAFAERVIGTLRRECLDNVIMGERHAREILEEYVEYYNAERAHQALEGDSPVPRATEPTNEGAIVARPHLGGLHHSYRRAA